MKKVAVIMGSDSDWPVVKGACTQLDALDIPYEAHILSAHRTPTQAAEFAKSARERGFGVVICAAGMAAHLAGAFAANTTLPVIGIPMKGGVLDGLDALLATVQMPGGIPVATVALNGAKNAAVLAAQILAVEDEALTRRILHKYSIKNVMGLNLLPLVRFDDPFEIIAHLMVGSEGTLAFLAGVTMRTEREYEHKASAMVYFSDIGEASRAVVEMRKLQDAAGERIVHSAEMLDRKSLASVGDTTGERLTALLTETKAHTPEELAANVARIGELLGRFALYVPARFTDDPAEQAKYWAVRSGIFPAVGGSRPAGTTCLSEDVAFHIEDLPRATAELQALIARHGYDACIYGHALEGNYHFIINQSFSTPAEVARYEALMNDVAELVVGRYDGSLKAEHGTGRNMAPLSLIHI